MYLSCERIHLPLRKPPLDHAIATLRSEQGVIQQLSCKRRSIILNTVWIFYQLKIRFKYWIWHQLKIGTEVYLTKHICLCRWQPTYLSLMLYKWHLLNFIIICYHRLFNIISISAVLYFYGYGGICLCNDVEHNLYCQNFLHQRFYFIGHWHAAGLPTWPCICVIWISNVHFSADKISCPVHSKKKKFLVLS